MSSCQRLRVFVILTFVFCGLICTGWVGAAEKTLKIHDYTGRGFAPDLVRYRLTGEGLAGKNLSLFDSTGKLIPLQFSNPEDGEGKILSFVAEVAPNAEATYEIRDSGGRKTDAGVRVNADKKAIVMSNDLLSLRLPSERKMTFDPAVPARKLQAPILSFRSGKSKPLGSSKILTERNVRAMRVELTSSGPVYAEIVYELEWHGGGYYRAQIRVVHRVPVVKVVEEYDLGSLDGSDFWELRLAEGWSPDRMEVARTHGNGSGIDKGKVKPLAGLAKMRNPRITPDTCPPSLSQLGLFNNAERQKSPDSCAMVGVVPLRKGNWRKMNCVPIKSDGPHDVRILFPMSARHATWPKDSASETSPFSIIDHDPGLSRTYGRRVWGLALGRPKVQDPQQSRVRFSYFTKPESLKTLGPFAQIRSFYGVIGLDRYKDYVLEWPDKDLKYPRLYRERGSELHHEAPKGPGKYLIGLCNAPITCPVISHHLTTGTYVAAAKADATLARGNLPEDVRKEMRARLALIMYLFEEPDFISYGNGAHTGNPNMGTSRYMGVNAFLPLVADHPMFGKWRAHVAPYTEYKMATQIAPAGAYFEYGASYHMHGYARTTNSLPGLISADAPNVDLLYKKYHKPDWDYVINLLTPADPRYKCRMLPGLANSGPGNISHLLEAAGSFTRKNPDFAANLVWAWKENGANQPKNKWIVPRDVNPEPLELRSRIYPGMGVIFRAHQGPNETYMLLRAGFNWSHWTPADPGHFFLLSRGSVLVPFQQWAYWSSADRRRPHPAYDMHNVIRFGHPENMWPYGWPDCNILDHAFGGTVEYAWASTGFPDWFISPGIAEPFRKPTDANIPIDNYRKLSEQYEQKQGAIEWDRQVLFMKGETATSPNYFVLRDSFQGDGQLASYLYLSLLGGREHLAQKGGRFVLDSEWPTTMDVVFSGPDKVAPDYYEERQRLGLHGTNLGSRLDKKKRISRDWVHKDGTPVKPGDDRGYEKRLFMRLANRPKEDYFWVLYPRDQEEPPPEIKQLAPGVMRIKHREGTDYAFLSSRHMNYQGAEVTFEGSTGTVRLHGDSVTLSLTGGAGRVGYKGHFLEGTAPLEETIPLDDLKPEVETHRLPDCTLKWKGVPEDADEVVPGLKRLKRGNAQHLWIESDHPVKVKTGDKQFYARRARVIVTPEYKRFVVPDPTYAKLTVGNVGVRGLGPFDLTFTSDSIRGKVTGRTRSIVTTWPRDITRPMYHMDGVRYYAGWADDPSISKGTETPQFAFAFGVTDGEHRIEVAEWKYPDLPPVPPRRQLDF